MSSQLIEYKYKDIYRFLSIIQDSVENEVSFWNFNEEMFVDAATKFNRITLLDIYVTTTLFNSKPVSGTENALLNTVIHNKCKHAVQSV